MSGLDDLIIEPLENAFDAVGAMEGTLAPLKRAAIGGGIGYLLAYGLKPAVAFDNDGNERPWIFGENGDSKDATYLPAWGIAVIPAAISSLFI